MIFIIGYGNPLRSDDAIGQQMALLMEQRLQGEDIQVKTAYQLTPELVEPISHAQLVIFIDARIGAIPGIVIWESIEPEITIGAFTHHVSPAALLSAAHELYGAKPKGILISIAGAVFDYGSELSPQLNRVLPGLADQIEAIIRTQTGISILEETNHA